MKEKLLSALQKKPYFLVLLPLFFVLHGYNDFFGFFPFSFTVLNLALTLLVCAFLYLTVGVFVRNRQKKALFVFWLLLIVLTFGSIHDLLKQLFHAGFASSYSFILPFLLLLFILLFILLKKSRSLFTKSFQFMNVLFLLLICYEFIAGISNYIHFKKGNNLLDNRFDTYKDFKAGVRNSDSAKPDIFFFVFDAMPSTKAMQSTWNYDNSRLDTFLQRENFYISKDSKSNYNLTVLSVSSTLNMSYTPPVDLYQDETRMYFKASASILDNSLTRILRNEDYTIFQYQGISFNNKDWQGHPFFKDMLYMNYFYKTLPGRIYRDLGWNFFRFNLESIKEYTVSRYEERNKKAEADLNKTIELVKGSCSFNSQKPKFLFAHFQLPHDPFIFDSTGKRKPARETYNISEENQPKAFLEQVNYANRVIDQLVRYIKTQNRKNTVIIIEGDHGYRNISGKKGYMIYDNLNSIYFPDGDYRSLYPSISPVNSFRVVLNKYFSANLPLLKDSSIFIPYTLPGEK